MNRDINEEETTDGSLGFGCIVSHKEHNRTFEFKL